MKAHHKHLYLARRKMSRVIDEIYTALLHFGCGEVNLRIVREESGLRLIVQGDFQPEYLEEILRMGELLRPAVRSAAMVEMYWELAGEDQYSSESEMALVGQMADDLLFQLGENQIHIEILVKY